jgi:3',5'-cyclic-AMP phosphodiesterase
MARLRLAVVTDIHYGPDAGAKLGSHALRLLEKFAKAAANFGPSLIVDMGDRVTAHSADEARSNMKSVKDYFNKLAAPVHSLLGNHDIRHLSRAENEMITGSPASSYSLDQNGYHLIFWNADVNPDKREGLHAGAEDIAWLKADLEATDKPTIVFSHVPLDNNEQDDLYAKSLRGYDANPFFYPEGAAIRDILEKSGKVILCMSGHIHKNRYREINGIHYIVQQSLTQLWDRPPRVDEIRGPYRKPQEAWSFIELEDDKIVYMLKGKVKKEPLVLIPRYS